MSSKDIIALKPPSFDGKDSNFSNWWAKFSAYAEVHGFGEALCEKKPRNLQAQASHPDHTDVNRPDAVKEFKMNALAIANFTMSFTNDNSVCMGFIFKSMDTDWPRGKAWVVVEKLLKRFRPNDLMVEIELAKKLSEISMKIDESPGVLFTQLAQIDNWYPRQLPEDKVLPALMMALPKESYRMVLTQ